MKKLKIPHELKSRKVWLPLLVVLLVAQSLTLGLVVWHQNTLWREINGGQVDQSNSGRVGFPLSVLIQNAVKGLYSLEPVTDPSKNLVYLPEAHLSLPLSQQSRNLRYIYEPADASADSPATVQVMPLVYLNRLVTDFNQVSCGQRIVGFTINKKDSRFIDPKFGGSTKLGDGRTLYFWLNDHPGSNNNYWVDGNNQTDVLNLLKQARSY